MSPFGLGSKPQCEGQDESKLLGDGLLGDASGQLNRANLAGLKNLKMF